MKLLLSVRNIAIDFHFKLRGFSQYEDKRKRIVMIN